MLTELIYRDGRPLSLLQTGRLTGARVCVLYNVWSPADSGWLLYTLLTARLNGRGAGGGGAQARAAM